MKHLFSQDPNFLLLLFYSFQELINARIPNENHFVAKISAQSGSLLFVKKT